MTHGRWRAALGDAHDATRPENVRRSAAAIAIAHVGNPWIEALH